MINYGALGNFSIAGMQFVLTRHSAPYISSYYFPSGMIEDLSTLALNTWTFIRSPCFDFPNIPADFQWRCSLQVDPPAGSSSSPDELVKLSLWSSSSQSHYFSTSLAALLYHLGPTPTDSVIDTSIFLQLWKTIFFFSGSQQFWWWKLWKRR